MNPISLRVESTTDEYFLRQLYASTRSKEMVLTPWSEALKEAFLNQQFDLQRDHYRQHYPETEFMLILNEDKPIGRWYLHSNTDHLLLLDISLLPDYCNQGIGSYLLNTLLVKGTQQHKPVRLHVENHNRAKSLYLRLGFSMIEDKGIYLLMQWLPHTTN
ncbi:GNAT family N-acetyltransferase [Methylomonas sp. AM2-LC]|uniref:GNAT family N-acetyltransferase n=1 Tax=Methylomonas sp. AM2-LC TaxID=3153301 RepID=UPI0032673FBE